MDAEMDNNKYLQRDVTLLLEDTDAYVYTLHKDDIGNMRKEVAEWLGNILGEHLSSSELLKDLASGVLLLRAAKSIEHHKQNFEQNVDCSQRQDLSSEASKHSQTSNVRALLKQKINIEKFLQWCREIGVRDTILFETEDLVSRKNERQVLNCILSIARIAARYGIEPPESVKESLQLEALRRLSNDTNKASQENMRSSKAKSAESTQSRHNLSRSSAEGQISPTRSEQAAEETTESVSNRVHCFENMSQDSNLKEQNMNKEIPQHNMELHWWETEEEEQSHLTMKPSSNRAFLVSRKGSFEDTLAQVKYENDSGPSTGASSSECDGSMQHRPAGGDEETSPDQAKNEAVRNRPSFKTCAESLIRAANVTEAERLYIPTHSVDLAPTSGGVKVELEKDVDGVICDLVSENIESGRGGTLNETTDRLLNKNATRHRDRFKYYDDTELSSFELRTIHSQDVALSASAATDVPDIPDSDSSDAVVAASDHENYEDEVIIIDYPPANSEKVVTKIVSRVSIVSSLKPTSSSQICSRKTPIEDLEKHSSTNCATKPLFLPVAPATPPTASDNYFSMRNSSSRSSSSCRSSSFQESMASETQQKSFPPFGSPRSPHHFVTAADINPSSPDVTQAPTIHSDNSVRVMGSTGDVDATSTKPHTSRYPDLSPSNNGKTTTEIFQLPGDKVVRRPSGNSALVRLGHDDASIGSLSPIARKTPGDGKATKHSSPAVVSRTLHSKSLDVDTEAAASKKDFVSKDRGSFRFMIKSAKRRRGSIIVTCVLLMGAIGTLVVLAVVFTKTS